MLKIKTFVFSPIQENTYLLYDEFNNCAIIDPGCYFDDEKDQLVGFITKNLLQPKMLLNTHCHLDHVFGNKWVYKTYNLIPTIHKNEEQMLHLRALGCDQGWDGAMAADDDEGAQ